MATKSSSKKDDKHLAEMVENAQRALAQLPMGGAMTAEMLRVQDQMLGEMEEFSRHWFERRHEALRRATELAQHLGENQMRDPATSAQAISEWYAGSLERITHDAREGAELTARCAGHLVRGGTQVGHDAVSSTTQAMTPRRKG